MIHLPSKENFLASTKYNADDANRLYDLLHVVEVRSKLIDAQLNKVEAAQANLRNLLNDQSFTDSESNYESVDSEFWALEAIRGSIARLNDALDSKLGLILRWSRYGEHIEDAIPCAELLTKRAMKCSDLADDLARVF